MKNGRLINATLEVNGSRWFVWEARSREDALNAIAHASCTGSRGARDLEDNTACGGTVEVLADVLRVNANQP